MSDTTPPEGTRVDPLLAVLGEMLEAQRGTRELLTSVAGDVVDTIESIERMTREVRGSLSELHAELQQRDLRDAQERQRMHADIRLVLDAVRNTGTRLTAAEEAVQTIRMRANGHVE